MDFQNNVIYLPSGEIPINAMVLGQTGVGKSSLINYLFNLRGDEALKTGDGAPITAYGDFSRKVIHYENFKITLYDSWGLEDGKDDKWTEVIFKKINSLKKNFLTQIHSIIYCISFSKKRIQDFEIDLISSLLEQNQNVIIILNQADLVNEVRIAEYKSQIETRLGKYKGLVDIVLTCSVAGKPKIGQKVTNTMFGRNEFNMRLMENYIAFLVCNATVAWENYWICLSEQIFNPSIELTTSFLGKVFRIATIQFEPIRYLWNQHKLLEAINAERNDIQNLLKKSYCATVYSINDILGKLESFLGVQFSILQNYNFDIGQVESGFFDVLGNLFSSGDELRAVTQFKSLLWVQKTSISISCKYLSALNNKKTRILINKLKGAKLHEILTLYYACQYIAPFAENFAYIKGITQNGSVASTAKKYADIINVNFDDVLVCYDSALFADEGLIFTQEGVYVLFGHNFCEKFPYTPNCSALAFMGSDSFGHIDDFSKLYQKICDELKEFL